MDSDLADVWDATESRYEDIDAPVARFNVGLLQALRPRWGKTIRPDTSMFTLLCTRPDTTGYTADERVEVQMEADDRVRVALVRQVPRRGETRPPGPVTVTGDCTRPENALRAVESLLFQLAEPSA